MSIIDLALTAKIYKDEDGHLVTGGCFIPRESIKPQEPAAGDEVLHVGPTFKVFISKPESYSKKINFVDRNNVIVGYDYEQDCCESFGWQVTASSIVTSEELFVEQKVYELDGYVFDRSFFMQRNLVGNDSDKESVATFRLLKRDAPDKFLHIFNFHNGYYSHGFTFSNNDKVIREGAL